MNEEQKTDSAEVKRIWRENDYRQFCKQSCTKISEGLEKLVASSGDRAIWELFQNARDIAAVESDGTKEAHIKITVTPTEFIFAHKGKPFDHDSFGSLVKQVSSQAKENDETVGQYGTGFITTHSFGRRIHVNGSLNMNELAPGMFVDIDNFVIDRVFVSIDEFVQKMAHQLVQIEDLADHTLTTDCREWTELRYQLDSAENGETKVSKAIEAAIKVMPYVMTVNASIGDVQIVDEVKGTSIKFAKQPLPDENGLHVMGILIWDGANDYMKKVYYLQSADGNDMVILPLKDVHTAQSLQDIPKLFVHFPLLGTEDFGFDFIFHSHRFHPEEERNAIHLPEDKPYTRAKYESNVRVLYEMTDMLFAYLCEHAAEISNWVEVATLKFGGNDKGDALTKEFFKTFKEEWVSLYESLPMFDIDGSRQSLSQVNVLSKDIATALAGKCSERLADLYTAVSCWMVPSVDEILLWSNVVASWKGVNSGVFLDLEDIAKELSTGKQPLSVLHTFDSFVKEMKRDGLFDEYPLIPNRDGVLRKKADLRDAGNIPAWLYALAKQLVEIETSRFVDEKFSDIAPLVKYGRNDLSKSINDRLMGLRKEHLDKGQMYPADVLNTIAKLASILKKKDGTWLRNKALPVILGHLGMHFDETVSIIEPLDPEERDLGELPFGHLVENMLLEISLKDSDWMKANAEYVLALHQSLHGWRSYYDRNKKEGLALKYGAVPNLLSEPCLAKELKKGVGIPDELLDLYKKTLGKDLREGLVDEKFAGFCDFDEINAKDTAKIIEDWLAERNFKSEITLDIILNHDDTTWASWFPRIANDKANLFMEQVVKPECKDSLFNIMKINDPDKLKQLADLAGETDIDEVIRLGKEARVKAYNESADFSYKAALGEYVENFIQAKLEERLASSVNMSSHSVKVVNAQVGQDLVVFADGEPIYFIEVKSRWNTAGSVLMTPTQMHRSVAEASRYALCCVDMTGFSQADAVRHEYPPFEQTMGRIKTVANIGELNSKINSSTCQNDVDQVHIGGDFKCVVPQAVINLHGISFQQLLDKIVEQIH